MPSADFLGGRLGLSIWWRARALPRTRKYRRVARLGCSGARWPPGVRQQQPRALLEGTGLAQSRPTTDGHTGGHTHHPPQMYTYVQTVQSPTCSPGPVQPPQSSNYELCRPGCGTPARPCGVICHLQPPQRGLSSPNTMRAAPRHYPLTGARRRLTNPPGPRPARQCPSRSSRRT
jgi:hypothetical protein